MHQPIRLAMAKFLLFLLTLGLVAASNGGAVTAATAEEDDLAQRREAMAQVVRLGNPSWGQPPPTDAATIHRLALFLKLEMGPIETIFHAIRKMPENSASEVRIKDEAFDAAMELLTRQLKVLLPHGCPSYANDAGFPAVSNTTESGAFEVLSKEEARAAAKELLNRHLPDAYLKNDDDQ
jgi:hypothetical protein